MIEVRADPAHLLPNEAVQQVAGRVQRLAEQLAMDEGVAFGDVTILIVSESRICDLHERYFNDPSPTDVITFPGVPGSEHGTLSGDIAICINVAREQAEDAGHSAQDELVFLCLHGLLHLCGWTDATPEERDAMLQRQFELIDCVENGRTCG